MGKLALISGSFLGALSVILGAFGAHGLKKALPIDKLSLVDTFDTGVKYQMYHAIVLLALGIWMQLDQIQNSLMTWAVYCFIIGVGLFSGSIYALVYLKAADSVGLGSLGVLTPIGGLFLVAGWMMVLIYVTRI